MENNSEFSQLFPNLFLPVRDEDESGGVVPSSRARCIKSSNFWMEFRRAAHDPEMIALGTSDESRAVIFLDFQNVIIRVEDQEKVTLNARSCRVRDMHDPRSLSLPETVLVTSSDNLDATVWFDGVLGCYPTKPRSKDGQSVRFHTIGRRYFLDPVCLWPGYRRSCRIVLLLP